ALIDQLGSDESAVRDAAEKQIIAIGKSASPAMEKLAMRDDLGPEVQQRAQDIVQAITIGEFTRPSRVSLHFNNPPPRDVYESLYGQADAKLATWPPDLFAMPRQLQAHGAKLVTIDLEKVSFWEAMQKLEEQTGITVRDFGQEMQLTDQFFGGRTGRS